MDNISYVRDVYNSKWIKQISDLQHDDGSWGYFHTLRQPDRAQPVTTEQALRRLRILGMSQYDRPVWKALEYMRGCLSGKWRTPDRREKVINWDAFEALYLATWLRLFVPDDPLALSIARMWAGFVAQAFLSGAYDEGAYNAAYRGRIPVLNKGEKIIGIAQFYMVNLMKGMLDEETENRYVNHIINNPKGVYYIYGKKIADTPAVFASRETGSYLSALEQLAGYKSAKPQLRFAVQWIMSHMDDDGGWDLGAAAKDGVNLPLSDAWRKPEDRRRDCTERINKLLAML